MWVEIRQKPGEQWPLFLTHSSPGFCHSSVGLIRRQVPNPPPRGRFRAKFSASLSVVLTVTRLVAREKVPTRVRARVRVQNPHPSPHLQFKKKNNFLIYFIYLRIYGWSPTNLLLTPDPTPATSFLMMGSGVRRRRLGEMRNNNLKLRKEKKLCEREVGENA